jgi:hypothetical protein
MRIRYIRRLLEDIVATGNGDQDHKLQGPEHIWAARCGRMQASAMAALSSLGDNVKLLVVENEDD